MPNWIRRYARWLHTGWPAGRVEPGPEVREDGSTSVPGLYVVGDLTGVPLLKFAADSGARAVRTILAQPGFRSARETADDCELAIVGAGVSGMAAALEARRAGLRFTLLEAAESFSTIANFPRGKPIFTYPTEMTPAGDLHVAGDTREALLADLRAQAERADIVPATARVERVQRSGDGFLVHLTGAEPLRARRVIVAIGRAGNYRRLGVPGQDRDKVSNRLHDPRDYANRDVLVVGGGDSALETALALTDVGARVTLAHRGAEFARPKPENVARAQALAAAGKLKVRLRTRVAHIGESDVQLSDDAGATTQPNDYVFAMIGREPPLNFFRRSGVPIRGEWRARDVALFSAFLAFCVFLYHWKKARAELPVYRWFAEADWFPFGLPAWIAQWGGGLAQAAATPGHLLHVLVGAAKAPSFYYTLAYCVCVVVFGVRRMRRRRTPYVRVQTWALITIQCLPLFVLPELLLPWAGQNGWFDGGALGWVAEQLFPNGEYWRAYGLILAWPLFIYNVFTAQPLWGWLVLSFVQTFVLIPILIYYWGKGAYCGWICSCGALAETLGDAHRHKMPHGPFWNRLNLTGQVILAAALALLALRVFSWIVPGTAVDRVYHALLSGVPFVNYEWFVDLLLAGILGVGCYFWFSGRVWCRFACPLAALMHIYARFSRFRILAEKKKCISCNVCTSVCHQGIDVMSFANKGLPMADPECVRCSACVQSCPTGVLAFGQVDPRSGIELRRDRLSASLVQLTESGRGRG